MPIYTSPSLSLQVSSHLLPYRSYLKLPYNTNAPHFSVLLDRLLMVMTRTSTAKYNQNLWHQILYWSVSHVTFMRMFLFLNCQLCLFSKWPSYYYVTLLSKYPNMLRKFEHFLFATYYVPSLITHQTPTSLFTRASELADAPRTDLSNAHHMRFNFQTHFIRFCDLCTLLRGCPELSPLSKAYTEYSIFVTPPKSVLSKMLFFNDSI